MANRRSILNNLTDVDQPPQEAKQESDQTATPSGTKTHANNIKPPLKSSPHDRNTTKISRGVDTSSKPPSEQNAPRKSRKASPLNPPDSPQRPSQNKENSHATSEPSSKRATREQRMAELIPYPTEEDAEQIRRNPATAVRVPSTEAAKRTSFYLHEEDHRDLIFAKTIDGADANTRVRAMIAYWRTNKQFREAVNRVANGLPRGPHKNSL